MDSLAIWPWKEGFFDLCKMGRSTMMGPCQRSVSVNSSKYWKSTPNKPLKLLKYTCCWSVAEFLGARFEAQNFLGSPSTPLAHFQQVCTNKKHLEDEGDQRRPALGSGPTKMLDNGDLVDIGTLWDIGGKSPQGLFEDLHFLRCTKPMQSKSIRPEMSSCQNP